MNIEELQTKTAYKCPKCNAWYLEKELALKHCAPKICEDCGKEFPRNSYYTVCDECHKKHEEQKEKERFEKAAKYTIENVPSESSEMFFCENVFGYDDYYTTDLDSVIEDVYCNTGEEPKYVYGTTRQNLRLDAYDILESPLEDLEDGWSYISDDDIKELQDFLDNWCKKVNVHWYVPNYKVSIVLDKSLLEQKEE